MKALLLRRRKLGKTSCNKIAEFANKDVVVARNDLIRTPITDVDILIRWGCTSEFPRRGFTLNSSEAIHRANNKALFRRLCREANVKIPETYLSTEPIPEHIFPAIARPHFHSQGRKVYYFETYQDFVNRRRTLPTEFYISKFIPKNKEVRIYCMNGRVLAQAEKRVNNPEAIAWNRAQGNSTFYNIRWDNWEIQAGLEALKAIKITGLDFGGVDVMLRDGEIYILEVNSAPSLTSEYRQQCFAKGIDFTINEIENNQRVPYFEEPTNVRRYRDIIHPEIIRRAE